MGRRRYHQDSSPEYRLRRDFDVDFESGACLFLVILWCTVVAVVWLIWSLYFFIIPAP